MSVVASLIPSERPYPVDVGHAPEALRTAKRTVHPDAARALESTAVALTNIRSSLNILHQAARTSPDVTATAAVTNITLTASTTINSPTATILDGALWIVRVCQNATGSWTVTWGANVMLGPLINPTFNGDPSTMCLITFVGIAGKWYVCGTPILGVPTL